MSSHTGAPIDARELAALVRQGEGRELEFKRSTGELRQGLQTLCSFLNGSGGVVLFGVRVEPEIRGGTFGMRQLDLVSTPHVTPQVAPQVTPQVVAVLAEAREGARSREELQEAAGIKDREHFRKAYLEPLLGHGWLERTIPDKPRSRLQRYKTTAAGAAVVEKESKP